MTSQPLGGDFGQVLKAWFAQNQWPQILAERVARAKGSKIGPWASQMSNCMQGKIQPKPEFFRALGWFNMAIATRDFEGITDRRTLDMVLNSQPLCHDNGVPFSATDFFGLYLGEIKAPKEYIKEKSELSQENVDYFWAEIRNAFRELALEMMCEPRTVWDAVDNKLIEKGIHADEIEWLREAIIGLRNPTLEECQRQRAKHPDMPLLNVLIALKEKCGGNQNRLGKFVIGCQEPPQSTHETLFGCV